MADQEPREPIVRSTGRTDSERYLSKLCARTFLSLWSYPGLYRDQRRGGPSADGKELADLVVVFEDDILLFSDKHCEVPRAGDIEIGWKRWFRRAVQKSAEQAWGAERWIRQHPGRLFLDSGCTKRFPFDVPDVSRARFHLVTVAHGISSVCAEMLGGSGSLMLRSDIRGIDAHSVPFTIGDLDPTKTFVHVLDDTSLGIVLGTLDTIADLTNYLRRKEELLRSKTVIHAAGEEELLAVFLRNVGPGGEHAFPFRPNGTHIALLEGSWKAFLASPQRARQLEADHISFMWDWLIEKFNKHALAGTQYRVSEGGARSTERIVRVMAREPRLRRRMLATGLGEILNKPVSTSRVVRVSAGRPGDPYYVFLLLPIPDGMSPDDYRTARAELLGAYCQVVKAKYPDALDIVGIATEPGITTTPRSEDAVYLDARTWTAEEQSKALAIQKELGLLLEVRPFRSTFKEYPDVGSRLGDTVPAPGQNPRNKPCPCGSGRKYKRCHGH